MKIIRHPTRAPDEDVVKTAIKDATIVSDSESLSESMSDSDEESSNESDSGENSDVSSTTEDASMSSKEKTTTTKETVEDTVDQLMEAIEAEADDGVDDGSILAMQKRLSEAEHRLAQVATIAEEAEGKMLAHVNSIDERISGEIAQLEEWMEDSPDDVEDTLDKINEEIELVQKRHTELHKQVDTLLGKKQNPGDTIEDKKVHIKLLESELKEKKKELREQLLKELSLLDPSEGASNSGVTITRPAESQGGRGVSKKSRKG